MRRPGLAPTGTRGPASEGHDRDVLRFPVELELVEEKLQGSSQVRSIAHFHDAKGDSTADLRIQPLDRLPVTFGLARDHDLLDRRIARQAFDSPGEGFEIPGGVGEGECFTWLGGQQNGLHGSSELLDPIREKDVRIPSLGREAIRAPGQLAAVW